MPADSTRFLAAAHSNKEEAGTFTGTNDYRVSGLSTGVTPPAGLTTTATYRGAFGTTNWASGWTNWQ